MVAIAALYGISLVWICPLSIWPRKSRASFQSRAFSHAQIAEVKIQALRIIPLSRAFSSMSRARNRSFRRMHDEIARENVVAFGFTFSSCISSKISMASFHFPALWKIFINTVYVTTLGRILPPIISSKSLLASFQSEKFARRAIRYISSLRGVEGYELSNISNAMSVFFARIIPFIKSSTVVVDALPLILSTSSRISRPFSGSEMLLQAETTLSTVSTGMQKSTPLEFISTMRAHIGRKSSTTSFHSSSSTQVSITFRCSRMNCRSSSVLAFSRIFFFDSLLYSLKQRFSRTSTGDFRSGSISSGLRSAFEIELRSFSVKSWNSWIRSIEFDILVSENKSGAVSGDEVVGVVIKVGVAFRLRFGLVGTNIRSWMLRSREGDFASRANANRLLFDASVGDKSFCFEPLNFCFPCMLMALLVKS
mmetsp:Transcript_10974/g.26932  ORF Transcript_10974/g.26932 Transcript_10974/m.26932 type:complete len:423 (+) Transcript_10974:2047-3315(+)